MSNLVGQGGVQYAATHRSRRVSVIWIVALVAVPIGAGLTWDTLSKKWPPIHAVVRVNS
jgi:paraquat-inducible protein B